jgi:hypothetical protein
MNWLKPVIEVLIEVLQVVLDVYNKKGVKPCEGSTPKPV